MCLYVDEPSEVLSETQPVARTEHKCDECRRMIQPGEKYLRWAVLEEGEFRIYKRCAHCEAIMDIGVALTKCPKVWFWGEVLSMDEEMGFVGNILNDEGHHLGPKDVRRYRRLVDNAKQGWRNKSGRLLPIPRVPALAGKAE